MVDTVASSTTAFCHIGSSPILPTIYAGMAELEDATALSTVQLWVRVPFPAP